MYFRLSSTARRSAFRRLDAQKVAETVEQLRDRIRERFPESSLGEVAGELLDVARESVVRAAWVGRPIVWLRVGVGVLVVLMSGVLVAALLRLKAGSSPQEITTFIQVLEAGINDMVLIGAGIFFLVTLESRIKRKVVLRAVHELRSLAHVVDTHQLTKDPERLLRSGPDTLSSPKLTMTPFELSRYLDYCAEMLSMIGKIGALHVEHFDDSAALDAVDDIEDLTIGLSRKVWQKIALVRVGPSGEDRQAAEAKRVPD